jgi:hypothetical protein
MDVMEKSAGLLQGIITDVSSPQGMIVKGSIFDVTLQPFNITTHLNV